MLVLTLAGCAGEPPADDALADAAKAVDAKATPTTGIIRGVVIDDALRPIVGASVVLQSQNRNTTTNDAGAFGFDGLEAGTYFLQASKQDYTTVQQSAEVQAGVGNPPVVKILIAAIPRPIPMIEALTATIFISGSGWVDQVGGVTVGGAGVFDGNWNFEVAISPNGTVAQTELVWDMTTPLGAEGRAGGGTYNGDDSMDTATHRGPSPLIMQANATDEDETADNVYYDFYAWPSAGLPAGFQFNQKVEAYIHVFHNFRPNEGWQFGRDGEHPLPS